jgi:thiamine-phosphate pyrophosphorylase
LPTWGDGVWPSVLMVLTDRRMAADAGHDLVDVVAAAVGAGAGAVLLREKDLPWAERHGLAERLRAATAGVALVVAGDLALARAVGADGVHLAAGDRGPGGSAGGLRVGRSCHTPEELVAAATRGTTDYATFSPVFATTSKPGYGPALGVQGLAAGCRAVAAVGSPLAVYALGGIGPAQAAACLTAGAAGIAVMGMVMRADDPAAVVTSLREELATVESGAVAGSADG